MANIFNRIKKDVDKIFGQELVDKAEAAADQMLANKIEHGVGKNLDELVDLMVKDVPEAWTRKKQLKQEIINEFINKAKTGEEPNLERAIRRTFGEYEQPQDMRQLAGSIAHDIDALQGFPQRTEEEITELGKHIPFNTLKDPARFAKWARENHVARNDAYSLLAWSNSIKDFLGGVDVEDDVAYDDVHRAYELAQTNSIILHRVNYLLHEQMIAVYDLLENDRRFKFMVKKNYKLAEDCWERYERPRQKKMERAAWCLLQDNMRLAVDTLQPRLQKVYETARDRMIFFGMKDIELRSRIVVALTVGKVQHHSFLHFFDDFKRDTHCDFRRLFTQDDLSPMTRCFADMVQALGIAVKNDKHGLPTLQDFDIDQSVRAGWAWGDFMRDLRDVELMDDAARRAIDLNPVAQQEYHEVLRQEEQKRQQQERTEMTERLGEKFKVTKM